MCQQTANTLAGKGKHVSEFPLLCSFVVFLRRALFVCVTAEPLASSRFMTVVGLSLLNGRKADHCNDVPNHALSNSGRLVMLFVACCECVTLVRQIHDSSLHIATAVLPAEQADDLHDDMKQS